MRKGCEYENSYTTVSTNDERFKYIANGHFWVAFLFRNLFVAAFTLLTATFLIWVFIFFHIFLGSSIPADEKFEFMFFYTGIMALICTVSLLLCGLAIRLCIRGTGCSWCADEEKFMTTVRGRITTMYYSQVETVLFEKMRFCGKVYGYTVTIIADGARLLYKQVFDSVRRYIPLELTPFYMLKERAGLLSPLITPEPVPFAGSGYDNYSVPDIPTHESETKSAALLSDIAEYTPLDPLSPETDKTAIIAVGGFFVAHRVDSVVMAVWIAVIIAGLLDMLWDSGGFLFHRI